MAHRVSDILAGLLILATAGVGATGYKMGYDRGYDKGTTAGVQTVIDVLPVLADQTEQCRALLDSSLTLTEQCERRLHNRDFPKDFRRGQEVFPL